MKSKQGGDHCKSKAIESCEGAIAVRCLIVVEVWIVAENFLRITVLWFRLLVALSAGIPSFTGESRAAHITITGRFTITRNVVKILIVAVRVIVAGVLELNDVQVCEGFESLNTADHYSSHCKFYDLSNLHFNYYRFVLQFYLKLINSRKSLEN